MNAQQSKCFNMLLTTNAVLLTLFVVIQIIDGPMFVQHAAAGSNAEAVSQPAMHEAEAPGHANMPSPMLTDAALMQRLEQLTTALERNAAMLQDTRASEPDDRANE